MRTAAKRNDGLGDEQNNCNAVTAGANSLAVTFRRLTIADAASNVTTSVLCRRHDSMKSYRGVPGPTSSSSINFEAMRILNNQT